MLYTETKTCDDYFICQVSAERERKSKHTPSIWVADSFLCQPHGGSRGPAGPCTVIWKKRFAVRWRVHLGLLCILNLPCDYNDSERENYYSFDPLPPMTVWLCQIVTFWNLADEMSRGVPLVTSRQRCMDSAASTLYLFSFFILILSMHFSIFVSSRKLNFPNLFPLNKWCGDAAAAAVSLMLGCLPF